MSTPDSPRANEQPPVGDHLVGHPDPDENRTRVQRALESGDKNAERSGRIFIAGVRGFVAGATRATAEFLLDSFNDISGD